MKFFSFTQLSWISSFSLFMYNKYGLASSVERFAFVLQTGICSRPLCYALVFVCFLKLSSLPAAHANPFAFPSLRIRFNKCPKAPSVLTFSPQLAALYYFRRSDVRNASLQSTRTHTHTHIEPSGKLWWNPFIMLQPTMKNICNQLWQLFCKNGQ